ncbi:MAG: M23 family metallopeptidase [Bacteroidales bacterium]|nr:M23 family metallopeptidase [Bacteroidales bacterium]MBP5676369.1 M23 family metallopeptidase [Bacteroidales bacterium]
MKKIDFKALAESAVRYVIASASMAIILYILFALVFSSQEERLLMKENRLYAARYKEMRAQEKLIGDVIDGLLEKDYSIYRTLFEAAPPMIDAVTAADLIADSDSLSESFYLTSAATKSGSLMRMASNVDADWEEIFRILKEKKSAVPPLSMPLKNISYVQTGASTGLRHNPVYKVEIRHDGLDLVVPQGAPVYASADGVVTRVTSSRKGLGNTVTIDHRNGYITKYCLLGEVNAVQGRSVKRGQKIGTVGISTQVAAPHLHYEVWRDSVALDPVNYLFASLSPEEYARMMTISVNTSQSMD